MIDVYLHFNFVDTNTGWHKNGPLATVIHKRCLARNFTKWRHLFTKQGRKTDKYGFYIDQSKSVFVIKWSLKIPPQI